MLGPSQKISKSAADSRHPAPSEASVPPPRQAPVPRHSDRSEASVLSSRQAPDPEQLRRVLSSPEGQALLRLLRADGGAGLQQAVSALRAGNAEAAKAALTPLLTGTEAEELSRRLEEKL